jgi:hypothetical protein
MGLNSPVPATVTTTCPTCGSAVGINSADEETMSFKPIELRCSACGFLYHANPAGAASKTCGCGVPFVGTMTVTLRG